MPKVHAADKVVDPALKSKNQARRRIPKPIPVIPKLVSQPQRIIPPVLSRKGQGRVGPRRKTISPKLKPSLQPQPSPAPPSILPCRLEPPPTAILSFGQGPCPRQPRCVTSM